MSWSHQIKDTPANVKASFQASFAGQPLQGHERVVRDKIVDQIVEAGKGYSADWLMNFSASGSATRVDGVEVNETVSVSITPVAA